MHVKICKPSFPWYSSPINTSMSKCLVPVKCDKPCIDCFPFGRVHVWDHCKHMVSRRTSFILHNAKWRKKNLELIPKITYKRTPFMSPNMRPSRCLPISHIHPCESDSGYRSCVTAGWNRIENLSKKTIFTGWSGCCTWLFRIDLTVVGNYLWLAGCAVWKSNNETAKTCLPTSSAWGDCLKKKTGFVSKLCHRASTASSLVAIIESCLLSKFKGLSLPAWKNTVT